MIAVALLKYRMASSHIHSWQRINHQLDFDIVLNDWLGPTQALICCDDCDDFALIHLIGWDGDRMEKRIFAVRDLPGAVVETFRSNISRDYCDLTRKQSETQALIHASAREASVIEISLPRNRICALSTQKCNPKIQDWQALDAEDYCHWHQYMM